LIPWKLSTGVCNVYIDRFVTITVEPSSSPNLYIVHGVALKVKVFKGLHLVTKILIPPSASIIDVIKLGKCSEKIL